MPTLDTLESRLQTLLEVNLLKFLPGYKVEERVFQQLANAMRNSLRVLNGTTFAPNDFIIIVHPSIITRWHSEPRFLPDLAKALQAAGEEAGFHFLSSPVVSSVEDIHMPEDRARIIASFSGGGFPETHGLAIEFQRDDSTENIPVNAFLLLDGTKIISLDLPVLNIGRRLNNQIVINDKRISRTHAQLRVTKGHFALFDLNSTGGTFVNGQRINKTILYPGDVISLAGVTLIYSQDLPSGQETKRVISIK
ncbi:MAG: FhaA domain-containing protein [Anaerolineales bacterium]